MNEIELTAENGLFFSFQLNEWQLSLHAIICRAVLGSYWKSIKMNYVIVFCFFFLRYNRIIIIGKWHCDAESTPKPQSVRRCTQWFVAQWWCLMSEAREKLNWKMYCSGWSKSYWSRIEHDGDAYLPKSFFFLPQCSKISFHIATRDILYNDMYRICWRRSLYTKIISCD